MDLRVRCSSPGQYRSLAQAHHRKLLAHHRLLWFHCYRAEWEDLVRRDRARGESERERFV